MNLNRERCIRCQKPVTEAGALLAITVRAVGSADEYELWACPTCLLAFRALNYLDDNGP